MRILSVAAAFVLLVAGARGVSAQEVRGFVVGGATSDLNHQRYPDFGGGLLVTLGRPWVAVGAQAETFFDWPYFTGRGAVFGEGRLLTKGPARPFVLAGLGFGEDAGPMIGGGIELRPPGQRIGLRLTVEDYIPRYTNYFAGPSGSVRTGHQVAVRGGISF